jgi:hypothetical protein
MIELLVYSPWIPVSSIFLKLDWQNYKHALDSQLNSAEISSEERRTLSRNLIEFFKLYSFVSILVQCPTWFRDLVDSFDWNSIDFSLFEVVFNGDNYRALIQGNFFILLSNFV